MYFVKTPWWLSALYADLLWQMEPSEEPTLYLTFDDGPHKTATPFALGELAKHGAKATFFCIGKNVAEHQAIYHRIIEEGHVVGNHTHLHKNGWKTNDKDYLNDLDEASKWIESDWFRPPYGRIKRSQAKQIIDRARNQRIAMWSVLSGDFDKKLSKETCLRNVLDNSGPGSIVVFHDSEKAFPNMCYALPKVLEHFSQRGFRFSGLPLAAGLEIKKGRGRNPSLQ